MRVVRSGRWRRGGDERRGTRNKKYKTLLTHSPIPSIHTHRWLTASDPAVASVTNVVCSVWQMRWMKGGWWVAGSGCERGEWVVVLVRGMDE